MESIKLLKSFKPQQFSGKVEDWPFWKLKFTAPLRTAGAIHFLLGMEEKPNPEYVTTASAVFGHLVNSLPETLLTLVLALPPWTKGGAIKAEHKSPDNSVQGSSSSSVLQDDEVFMDCPHPSTVWKLLLKKFENNTSVHMRILIKQLIQIKMDKDFDIYEATLNQIVNRLSGMGEKISDALRLGVLLNGLPPRANSIVSIIDSSPDYDYSSTVATLSNHFSREAAKRAEDASFNSGIDPSAFNAEKKRPYCTHCKEHGHGDKHCWELNPEQKPEHLKGKPRRKNEANSKPCKDASCPCHRMPTNDSSNNGSESSNGSGPFAHFIQTIDAL